MAGFTSWEQWDEGDAFAVVMVDRFMSGWGKAEGRRSVYILGARDRDEANVVAANARARSEMQGVRIEYASDVKRRWFRVDGAARRRRGVPVLSTDDRQATARWRRPGGFSEKSG